MRKQVEAFLILLGQFFVQSLGCFRILTDQLSVAVFTVKEGLDGSVRSLGIDDQRRLAFRGQLRVSDRDEALGLDVTEHGESAYPAFTGLDA